MRHPRRKHKGYKGRKATPWKYLFDGRWVRRGAIVRVSLRDRGTGEVLWEGDVVA